MLLLISWVQRVSRVLARSAHAKTTQMSWSRLCTSWERQQLAGMTVLAAHIRAHKRGRRLCHPWLEFPISLRARLQT